MSRSAVTFACVLAMFAPGLGLSQTPPKVPIVDDLDTPSPEPERVEEAGRQAPENGTPTFGEDWDELDDDFDDEVEEDAPPPPRLVLVEPEAPSPVTEERLRAHLEVRAAALRSGDHAEAELALGLLEEARDALGTPNAIFAAVVLVEEAQVARGEGRPDEALGRARHALRLAPDLLAAHWLHIQLLIDQDATRVARISRAIVLMGSAWLRSFRNQVHLSTLVFLVVLSAVVLTWTLVAVALLARHLPYQAHDLSRGLPRVIGGGEMTLLLLLAVLLPGGLGLGWPTSIALGLALTLAYQSVSERVLSVVGVLLVSSSPWLAGASAPLVAFHGSRVDHLAALLEEALAEPAEVALRAHVERHPEDGLTHLALGVRAALRDDLVQAEQHLNGAKKARPSDPVTLNDLAVIQYRRGAHERAEQHLRAAAAQAQNRAQPHLNLSLIAADRGDFVGAERHLREAQAIDPELVRLSDSKAGLAIERRLFLIHVSAKRLWGELYALDEAELGATRAELWRWVGGYGPTWSVPAMGLLALALGLLGFRTENRTRPCSKCGQPAQEGAPGGLCSQCQSVFMNTQTVSSKARLAKEEAIRRHQVFLRWGERVAALVPGLGSLMVGRALTGFVQLFLFSIALGLIFARSWLWLHAWHVPGDGTGRLLLLSGALVLAGALSLFSLWRAFGR